MSCQFIEVKKITHTVRKDKEGNVIKDPETKKPLKGDPKIVSELIRLDEVKSAREWHNKGPEGEKEEHASTLLYMYGDRKEGRKPAEMLIVEDYKDFMKRIGAVTL